MDPERSHGGSSSSSSMSDLFICFTSGPSSSSFGRRLMRSNGSMKGGQASPMFSNGKKKSSGFENPEPSSPKVTCIGQVRVKSKKQGKKFRACRSKRTGMDHNNGSNNNSQECKKWVHLPLTICEALRAFGAEYFYCFLPSCMTNQREDKQDKTEARSGDNDDDDDEKRKSSERHAFEDIEINDDEDEEDEARLSISCIPPKDALLLTRCRSDPIKMAAFANKFLDLDPKNEEEQNPEAETNAGESKEEQGNDEDADQQESTIKEQTLNLHGEENIQETGSSSMVGEEEKTQERSELECTEAMKTDQEGDESKESESQQNLLPDCLLLMMCEPKLSMEVSKETWVCSKDFIREKEKQPLVKQKVVDFNNPVPVSLQPPSSSCSFSAAPPTAAAAAITNTVDEKVVGGKGCEPFVLTRCMSEPMMRSSAKLASNGCKWKNEPTKLGVGF
ncbi:hypothetical protein CXB51_021433 [Gossypium anomalum]|uniref:Suppressor protein SRP40-like n=1 Tax=Gossypium anomalum TaxID=47600 RepID=A0A8J5YMJ4_9ROSI|nr:hypothetical protein CXB51_021433 [Gossypium anomalum]